MSVSRVVSRDGASFDCSSFFRMNQSIGFRTQSGFESFGFAGSFGATNAQCSCQSAPVATHFLRSSICSRVRCLFEAAGGILRSGSSDRILATSSLASAFPGTMTGSPDSPLPSADVFSSSRKPPLRCFSSGPWQAKQLLDRIGRMSRLKSIESSSLRAERPEATREIAESETASNAKRFIVCTPSVSFM